MINLLNFDYSETKEIELKLLIKLNAHEFICYLNPDSIGEYIVGDDVMNRLTNEEKIELIEYLSKFTKG